MRWVVQSSFSLPSSPSTKRLNREQAVAANALGSAEQLQSAFKSKFEEAEQRAGWVVKIVYWNHAA